MEVKRQKRKGPKLESSRMPPKEKENIEIEKTHGETPYFRSIKQLQSRPIANPRSFRCQPHGRAR